MKYDICVNCRVQYVDIYDGRTRFVLCSCCTGIKGNYEPLLNTDRDRVNDIKQNL